jgi:hypothetical protein
VLPPSSSRLTAAFALQLLLPTCRTIRASPPLRGSRELTASGRHLHTSLRCTSSPCMVILLPPVVGPALASALPRRRSLRDRPCQGTAVRDLVALRASRSRAATPHLRPHTSEPRASLARIALLLTRLKPPCASLLAPGHSPPLEPCSCVHMLTLPACAPCLPQPCCVILAHPSPSACTPARCMPSTPARAATRLRHSLQYLLRAPNSRTHASTPAAQRSHAPATD